MCSAQGNDSMCHDTRKFHVPRTWKGISMCEIVTLSGKFFHSDIYISDGWSIIDWSSEWA